MLKFEMVGMRLSLNSSCITLLRMMCNNVGNGRNQYMYNSMKRKPSTPLPPKKPPPTNPPHPPKKQPWCYNCSPPLYLKNVILSIIWIKLILVSIKENIKLCIICSKATANLSIYLPIKSYFILKSSLCVD